MDLLGPRQIMNYGLMTSYGKVNGQNYSNFRNDDQ